MAAPEEFSTTQWIIVIVTQRITGTFSIIGSSLIIFMSLQNGRARLAQMQNRLIFGMSIIEIINTISLIISTAATPREFSDHIYGASGTKLTCSIQSFLFGMGFSVPCYNAMLSIYYMGVIKYNMSDDALEKYERPAHLIAILYPLLFSIFGLCTDIFQPKLNVGCWVGDKCSFADPDSECQPRPMVYIVIFRTAMSILVVTSFLIIIFCMTSIYLFVREQALTMAKYQSFRNENSLVGSSQKKGVHEETYIQSVLYVSAYACTYLPTFIVLTAGLDGYFAAQFLRRMFYPLQGFWNFITFIRPRVVLERQKYRNARFLWILKVTIFGISPEEERKMKNHYRSIEMSDRTKKQMAEKRRSDLLAMVQRSSQPNGTYGKVNTKEDVEGKLKDENDDRPPSSSDHSEEEKEEIKAPQSTLFATEGHEPVNQQLFASNHEDCQLLSRSSLEPQDTPHLNLAITESQYAPTDAFPHPDLAEIPQKVTTFTSLIENDFIHNSRRSRERSTRRQSFSLWMQNHKPESTAKTCRRQSLPTNIHDLDSISPSQSALNYEEGIPPSLSTAAKDFSEMIQTPTKADSTEDRSHLDISIEEEAE